MLPLDTIVALSTPYGSGAIAVIRMSGTQAIPIAEQVVGRVLTKPVHFCSVPDLDDLVVTVFRSPHSFTGEDVVELSCHGSLYIQRELQQRLIDAGARTARAGEFTQRAFLNGKMDLMQAEAVADLIAAQTRSEVTLALHQLRGGISSELAALREQLLHLTSLLELELDFGDHEELEFADRTELRALADCIEKKLASLTDSFQTGNAIKEGIPVAIVGKTNAGKSTLLNALLGEDRAIVSAAQGTTRDTIEEPLIIEGVLFRLIDTAGLRVTDDAVEQEGMARSRRAMAQASIIVHVVDAVENTRADELPDIENLSDKKIVRVWNKADLLSEQEQAQLMNSDSAGCKQCVVSAKNNEIDSLKRLLMEEAGSLQTEGNIISSVRHYEALCNALRAIRSVQQGLERGLSGELLSEDLQVCLTALGEITGQITSQEVLNNIFSKFCIGK